jgi:hypothetical protein
MERDEQEPNQQPATRVPRVVLGGHNNRTGSVGQHFGGVLMFLSMIPNEAENARYLERTAHRLRSMAESTTGLDGADPLEVRARLKARDRYVRHQASASRSVA